MEDADGTIFVQWSSAHDSATATAKTLTSGFACSQWRDLKA
jgi:hypothetical protein